MPVLTGGIQGNDTLSGIAFALTIRPDSHKNIMENLMQTDLYSQSSSSSSAQTAAQQKAAPASATAPGQLRVIKRNGAVVGYDESKLVVAITKA